MTTFASAVTVNEVKEPALSFSSGWYWYRQHSTVAPYELKGPGTRHLYVSPELLQSLLRGATKHATESEIWFGRRLHFLAMIFISSPVLAHHWAPWGIVELLGIWWREMPCARCCGSEQRRIYLGSQMTRILKEDTKDVWICWRVSYICTSRYDAPLMQEMPVWRPQRNPVTCTKSVLEDLHKEKERKTKGKEKKISFMYPSFCTWFMQFHLH